jgi:hypothetical protein
MDFCPALDMANICIQLEATLGESEDWTSKDFWTVWAAWAQAIGSIAAIFIAGRIANKQLLHQREDAVNARIQELDKLLQFFDHCNSVFLKIKGWNAEPFESRQKTPGLCREFKAELKILVRRTQELSIQSLASPMSMSFVASFERALETAAQSIIKSDEHEKNPSMKEILTHFDSNLDNAVRVSALVTNECLSNMRALRDSTDDLPWYRRLARWIRR